MGLTRRENREMTEEELEQINKNLKGLPVSKQAKYFAVASPDDGTIKLCMFGENNEVLAYVEMPPIVLVHILSTMASELTEIMVRGQERLGEVMSKVQAEVENVMRDGEMDA